MAAFGIVEERGEREELLDDIILTVNGKEEERRYEMAEKTEIGSRLQEAGEVSRNQQ